MLLDDGFAGGVCRCQFCGTIQTVPAHLKGSGDVPVESAPEREPAFAHAPEPEPGPPAPTEVEPITDAQPQFTPQIAQPPLYQPSAATTAPKSGKGSMLILGVVTGILIVAILLAVLFLHK